MKRFWHTWLAVGAVLTVAGTANGQWNQSPEIGSYQSILARSGYGQPQAAIDAAAQIRSPRSLPGQLALQNQGSGSRAIPSQVVPQHHGDLGSSTRSGGVIDGGSIPPQGSATRQDSVGYNYAAQTPVAAEQFAGAIPQGAVCNSGSCGGGTIYSGGLVGGSVVGGCASGGLVGGGVGSYVDYGSSVGGVGCGDAVYQPGANINLGKGSAVNRVGGIYGLVLRRNYEDELRIGANAGQDIFSDDVDLGDLTGVGVNLATRRANGNGWEVDYWGLEEDAHLQLANPDFVSLGGLEHVTFDTTLNPASPTVFDVFNDPGQTLRTYRDNEISSLEVNLLRNGGNFTTRFGRSGTFELLGGVRLFQFDETFRLVEDGGTANAASTEYRLEADNLLIGGQLGARTEFGLTRRLRLSSGINFGLFNNNSETNQRIFDPATGTNAVILDGLSAGQTFDFSGEQDDISILGELRLGLIYQLSNRVRANVGYRALGLSGLALAVDQVPINFEDGGLLQRPRSNGSLLLHGVVFGIESCF